MEHVQSVLFLVPAEKVDEMVRPAGLLAALEGHKGRLQQTAGFLDMVVVRSLNDEGEVQVVVQTKWRDPDALADYEEGEVTVASLLERYRDLVTADSLQVYDMEVLL